LAIRSHQPPRAVPTPPADDFVRNSLIRRVFASDAVRRHRPGTARGKAHGGGEWMSQRAVEIVLGRLATDESLRRRFRQSPESVLKELIEVGLELSRVEQGALQSLDAQALQRFAHAVDARLKKAELVARAGGGPGQKEDEENVV
jgi:hypothetical protein